MDRGENDMDPCAHRSGVVADLFHLLAGFVQQAEQVLWWRGSEYLLSGVSANHVRRPRPQPTCGVTEPACQDPVVKGHDQLSVPAEGGVIGSTKHEGHRVSVTFDESLVLVGDLWWLLAGQDATDLLDGDGYALHRCRGSDRFRLELSAKPSEPRSGERGPIIQALTPSVELPGEFA